MSTTDIAIINMGFLHVGHTQFIQSRSESSHEASVSNLVYDQAVQFCLEDYAWGFTTKYGTPGLVEAGPNEEWAFAYRYPVDCLKVRRIVTALGETNPTPPPFITGQDDTGRLIYTDVEDAEIVYTKNITSTARFPAMFSEAVSWWLAGLMCPGLSKDSKQAAGCFQMYAMVLQRAQAAAGNEAQSKPEPESEAIRSRA